MWIFSIPILLLELRRPPLPALFLPALYGFCSGASTILFGPIMGEWVDHVSRLHGRSLSYAFLVPVHRFGAIYVSNLPSGSIF